MTKTMTRGKQQILFNYLPGKTFDFERGPISRVVSIRGFQQSELNEAVVIGKIATAARAWSPAFRPGLGDHVLDKPSNFVLLDPVEVEAEMYPKVFWCQNQKCSRVIDATSRESVPSSSCPVCKTGKLVQMRWIKVHVCGAMEPLTPPECPKCHSRDISLNTRESERLSAFRWVCRKCNHNFGLYGGHCRNCEWPDKKLQTMDIEVHRAGRTYFPQTAVLLNIPRNDLDGLLANKSWPYIVGAKFIGLPEIASKKLSDFFTSGRSAEGTISPGDFDKILEAGLTPEQALERLKDIRSASAKTFGGSGDAIAASLASATGVGTEVWKNAGAELLEAIIPYESDSSPALLSDAVPLTAEYDFANKLGIKQIGLASDYTIVNATFGFTRGEYQPNECWLNPFPPDRAYKGRLPIYVDRVQADALLLTLDHSRILRWLRLNGIAPKVPAGENAEQSERAYFVSLFDNASLYHSIGVDQPELRMVFGLLHTLSHICLKQASLLCGLEKTSLSEYLIPSALTIALYCNHRFGSTIGALTALFEQALHQWLTGIRDTRNCVYDPVCHDDAGSCHACTHLSETSCRFFNLNLSRSYLFGGPDNVLGEIRYGYFDLPAEP